jgi:pyruvate dehydrogenase E2 component (dihydrolipoamide acetyltransferase)
MLQRVVLPQLGQTMEEGTIETWHKSEGDYVEKGEVLFDLTTDKATLEVQAFAEGVLKKILAGEGDVVPVNDVVALIGAEDDEVPEDLSELTGKKVPATKPPAQADAVGGGEATGEADAPAPAPQAAPAAAAASGPAPGRIFSSPRARKVAREKHVAVEALTGSGPNGRIIERDVLAHLESLEGISYTPAAAEAAFDEGVSLLDVAAVCESERVSEQDVRDAVESGKVTRATGGAAQTVQLSPMRRTIAERMTASKQSVPHFYLVGDVPMRQAVEFVGEYAAAHDLKVTPTALIVKAMGMALREHPAMNASFRDGSLTMHGACNVGVAVGVEDGLFVPVVRDADRRSLAQVAQDIRSLARTAREGGLRPDQYEGGCATVSNLGMFGVDFFQPIINPPESCILGVGAIQDKVVAVDGGIRIEPICTLSLAADHRVVDGVAAAQFFRTVREILADPSGIE